ncbi:MAG: hypothetical protein R2705_13820 [Ilumatobacteraceae bacterium]
MLQTVALRWRTRADAVAHICRLEDGQLDALLDALQQSGLIVTGREQRIALVTNSPARCSQIWRRA